MPSSRLGSPTSASSPNRFKSEEGAIATQLKLSDDEYHSSDKLGTNFAGSLFLHGLIAAIIFGWAFIFHTRGTDWGENASNAGAIQATMVSSLPLPPTQRTLDTGVLTSEAPSPAPVVTKEKTEPPPAPKRSPSPSRLPKNRPRHHQNISSPSHLPPRKPSPGRPLASASRNPHWNSKTALPVSPSPTVPSALDLPTTSTSSTAKWRRIGTPQRLIPEPLSARARRSSSISTAKVSHRTLASKPPAAHPRSISLQCAPSSV
jgi:hypothetical protein